ncbi:MAG: hypothetical protein CMB80_31665 [Flammeovirgaceae bacterium]|nr:hypothetical protein [Flammeovirgaceae bacterium]MBE62382.1 hypothetical protein [Flammeovirgaceae bacterium]
MLMTFLLILINLFVTDHDAEDYVFVFNKIDNKVEILVNDSLIFDSGTVNHNPELEGLYTCNITKYLTSERDVVVVRLYNGFEPYPEEQKDKHWEIEYSLNKDGVEVEQMWNEGDDFKIGLVFEEIYYL